MTRQLSDNGLKFIAGWETFCPRPMFVTADERARGIITWGYGHTGKPSEAPDFISQADAMVLLKQDVQKAVAFADRNVSTSLNQAQFDAIVDLCFNVGTGVIAKDNVLGDFDDAARNGDIAYMQRALPTFRYQSGKPLLGLYRRAMGRLALFNGDSADVAERKGRMIMAVPA